jgi:uncharacterized membrane protein YgcG
MTTTARHTPSMTRLLLAAVVGALALGAAGARPAAAATSASLNPTDTCWRAVINDWFDNNRVDKVYAIPCYTQAIQHLSQFPDVQGYSSAPEDIHNALLAALRQDRGSGGGTGGGGSGPSSSGGGSSSGQGGGQGGGADSGSGFFHSLGDRIGPGNAQSIPLPLLVLGALALLLLLAAAGTWLARRIQARRMTPAPSPVRRP